MNERIQELQAEQEPVGYWDGKFSKGGASALYEVPQESAFGYHYENYPLYAAPVQQAEQEPVAKRFEKMHANGDVWITTIAAAAIARNAAPVRTKDLTDCEIRLKRIATIAHCGGLANMSEDDALTAIRKITLPYFDREASDEEARAVIAADRGKNK